MDLKDCFTMLLGGIGTGLGIFNTWRAHSKDRPRLKVIPKVFRRRPDGFTCISSSDDEAIRSADGLCIEIVNTGSLAVTVDEIGFTFQDRRAARLVLTGIDILCYGKLGGRLPHRLDPQDSITAFVPRDGSFFRGCLAGLRNAYTCIAGGQTFIGSTPAFDLLARNYKDHPEQVEHKLAAKQIGPA